MICVVQPTPTPTTLRRSSSISSSINESSIPSESFFGDAHTTPTPTTTAEESIDTDSTSDAFCELLICPISLELPYEPVFAQDGRVYEREAIAMHFQSQMERIGQVKSPITNQVIDSSILLPAIQHKQLIEMAIERGLIKGELAETWKDKREHYTLRKLAIRGDVYAMQRVSYCLMKGIEGFPSDEGLSFRYAERAHRRGSTMGTALMGWMIIKGRGVSRANPTKGIRYLTKAAHNGSTWAAYRLGMAFADGLYGLEVDETIAIHWLQLGLSSNCPHDDITGICKSKAQTRLEELITNSSNIV